MPPSCCWAWWWVCSARRSRTPSSDPYAVDLVALRRIRPDVFSILMCLEPAAAAFAGVVVLGEFLSPLQWLAVASVMVASVGATRSQEPIAEPALD